MMQTLAIGGAIFTLGMTILTIFLGPSLIAIATAILFVGFCCILGGNK